jgi:hypothetical protein
MGAVRMMHASDLTVFVLITGRWIVNLRKEAGNHGYEREGDKNTQ